jgi:adenosylcobinamide-GDP ribazoletransferase
VVALQFLTRLPLPNRELHSPEPLSASLRWFPLVGAVIGLVAAFVDLAARIWLAPPVAQALVVAALVVVTGALHLDGLIDAVDGLSAAGSGPERLAAMHQPVVGNVGSLVGTAALLITFVAVGALPDAARFPALVIAPISGRAGIVLAYVAFPYGRADPGISLSLKQGATQSALFVALVSALLLASLTAGLPGIGLLLIALIAAYGWGRLAMTRLPGLTGDVYGAIGETSQVAVLLLAAFIL